MKFSKKQLTLLLGTILLLGISNVALAILYVSRNLDITGGVEVNGDIQVYDEDGETVMTGYAFPLFTGGTASSSMKNFFINNTGNQVVYVYWSISASSLTWNPLFDGYSYVESLITKYYLYVQISDGAGGWDNWTPSDYSPTSLEIPVGEGQLLRLNHQYTGNVNTPETFDLIITFNAADT